MDPSNRTKTNGDPKTPVFTDSDRSLLFESQGRSAFESGDYLLSLKYFNEFVTLAPDKSRAYVGRAEAHVGLGNYEQALQEANLALHLEPTNVDAWIARGRAHFINKQYQDSICD